MTMQVLAGTPVAQSIAAAGTLIMNHGTPATRGLPTPTNAPSQAARLPSGESTTSLSDFEVTSVGSCW